MTSDVIVAAPALFAVIWSADDGQVVSATPTFGDLVGRPPGQLIGRPAAELGLHVDASASGTVDDAEPWRVTSAQVELRTVTGAARLVEARSHLMRVRGERLVLTTVEEAPQEQGLLELRKATEELTQQLSRVPEEAELAERLGVSRDDMQEARQADLVFSTYSLDAPMSDRDDPALLADMLGDDDPDVAHTIDMEAVNKHWDELPEREQRILVMRFYGNLTQTEIGERLGISQMHVSRLLARALGHLKSRLLDPAETETPHSAATA